MIGTVNKWGPAVVRGGAVYVAGLRGDLVGWETTTDGGLPDVLPRAGGGALPPGVSLQPEAPAGDPLSTFDVWGRFPRHEAEMIRRRAKRRDGVAVSLALFPADGSPLYTDTVCLLDTWAHGSLASTVELRVRARGRPLVVLKRATWRARLAAWIRRQRAR